MKRHLACFILAISLLPLAVGAETSFLLIGNSHTDAHGLDNIFASLAESGGHSVYVTDSTVGGSTLSYHSHHQPTLDRIHERDWDFVVLQEHSLLPVIEHWVINSFYPKAALLDSIITGSGSHTALFLHHARENPSGTYCVSDYCSREFVDYFDMQAEMSAPYYPLADALGVPLAPVGDVWASALLEDPSLPLWGVDELHASLEGAYLTACVFYTTFFGESPVGISYTAGLDASTALMYQEIAGQAIASAGRLPSAASPQNLSAHPNPFNPSTEIRFDLLEPVEVTLSIFDTAGRRVRMLEHGARLDAGTQRVMWNGRDDAGHEVATGVYVLSLEAGTEVLHCKLTLLK